MPTYVIIALVLFFAILILGVVGNEKKKQVTKDEEEKLKASGISLTKKTATYHGTIGMDEKNRKLVLITNVFNSGKSTTFDFSDIFECELIKDGNTVFKKSATRTIGGAVLGGALSGGVGAIVGGLSGSSKSVEDIKKIEIKLVVKDLANPTHRFVFFDSTADNKMLLNNLKHQAEMWKDTISLIMDQEDQARKAT